jgi:hypothetical protein
LSINYRNQEFELERPIEENVKDEYFKIKNGGKEIVLRSVMQKVLSQDLQQNRRQWYLSLFQAFTLLNVYLHALAVDIGDFNVNKIDGLKDIIDLLGAEHQRKGFGHLRSGQVLFGPCFMADVHKEKLERIVAHLHAARFVIAIGEHGLEISSQLVDRPIEENVKDEYFKIKNGG